MKGADPLSLDGKVAIVTGGGGHIGSATARRLASDGAAVVVCDVNGESARTVAAGIVAEGGRAVAIETDVRNTQSIEAMVGQTIEQFGRIDILVNVAGGSARERASTVHGSREEVINDVLDVNLRGTIFCCRAVIGHMIEQGAGKIVNVASALALQGQRGYAAAKARVIALTKALGKELALTNIRVNCVAPAAIDTDILAQLTPEFKAKVIAKIPMGRLGRAEEVANLVNWLASEECSFSTGAVFDASGGRATY